MFALKRLAPEGVPAGRGRAEPYRLLNEPLDAESICEDVLAVAPGHQGALVMLLLALTDQFSERLGPALARARGVLTEIHDHYARLYYTGLVAERAAKSHLRRGGFASGHVAYELTREAMAAYELAAAQAPPGNDEANLRWNTCARLIDSNPHVTPAPVEREEPMLDARVDD